MKKTYYTNAPEPSNEDYQLPWFLRDEEKYVELMAAVAKLLDGFPYDIDHEDFSRLNEAYSQIIRGPHAYVGVSGVKFGVETKKIYMTPGHCVWCDKDSYNHR